MLAFDDSNQSRSIIFLRTCLRSNAPQRFTFGQCSKSLFTLSKLRFLRPARPQQTVAHDDLEQVLRSVNDFSKTRSEVKLRSASVAILIKYLNLYIMVFSFKKRLSAEQAKGKVFEHWNDLNVFSKRRFPDNENQALQALDYALDQLQSNDWNRVREWEGKGRFLTFLLTLVSHLFTDYTRKQVGHHRPPKWIAEKNDMIWNKAYKTLIIQRYSRQEAFEILKVHYPNSPSIFNVIESILENCTQKPPQLEFTTVENLAEQGSIERAPMMELMLSSAELIEILLKSLSTNEDSQLPAYLEEGIAKLKALIDLNEEDRMLLLLRYEQGLSMNDISKLLKLEGNLYKRHNKLIEKLQIACEEAGLMPQEINEEDQ